MFSEFKSFMNSLRYIIGYAVDRLPPDIISEKQSRYFNLTNETFFKELYEPRKVENFLEEQLGIAPDLLCFVGPRGSGKSSIGNKFRYSFEKDEFNSHFITFIDIRLQAELKSFKFETSKELEESLRQIIIDNYLDKIFKLSKDNYTNRLKLYEYIINDEKDLIKPKDLFWVFRKMKDKAIKLYIKYTSSLAERKNISYFDWLKEEFLNNKEVSKICDDILENIDIAHLVYAAGELNFKRQIIWIDNVDRLPEAVQPDFVNFLRNCLNQMSIYMTIVLSLREENINRDFDQTEEETPPYPRQIFLENPKQILKACDLPIVDDNVLKNIVKKRLIFTRNYQRDIHEELKNKIHNKAHSKSEIKEKEQAKKDISFFAPPISDKYFELLQKLSDIALDAAIDERAKLIANNSIRSFLLGHFHFLEYLLNIPSIENELSEGYPAALRYYEKEKKWYISTLFYFYIRHSVENDAIGFSDIIEIIDKYDKGSINIGCFLPNLVITSIWNLTLDKTNEKRHTYKNPTVSEVIERLELLGYKREEIIDAIYELYNVQETRSNIIEFRSRRTIKNKKDIKEDTSVYVTYRGKCFVSLTCSSFGYIYESIRYYENKGAIIFNPHITDTSEYAEKIFPYLCKIAKMHCETLKKIRSKGSLNNQNFLIDYLDKFGIPLKPPCVYNPTYGVSKNGVRRVLHLESILIRMLLYVRIAPVKEKLNNLLTLYNKQIESIASNEDDDKIIDFENEILN